MAEYEHSDLRPPPKPSHWSKRPPKPHRPFSHSSTQEPSQWSQSPPKPHVAEDTLKSGQVEVERKKFVFQLKENRQGRLLRITEEGQGHDKRSSIIVPATGLKEFADVLQKMMDACPPPDAK